MLRLESLRSSSSECARQRDPGRRHGNWDKYKTNLNLKAKILTKRSWESLILAMAPFPSRPLFIWVSHLKLDFPVPSQTNWEERDNVIRVIVLENTIYTVSKFTCLLFSLQHAESNIFQVWPGSITAMQAAVGTVCEPVDKVIVLWSGSPSMNTTTHRARSWQFRVDLQPPGHHCGEDTPSLFCFKFLNDSTIGAAHGDFFCVNFFLKGG